MKSPLWGSILIFVLASCSQPDLKTFRNQHAAEEIQEFQRRIQTLETPLDLETALRLALEGNSEYALMLHRRKIQSETETGALLDLFPHLYTDAEYRWRSELTIASSRAADSGIESLESSFSQQRDGKTASFEVLFSLLDFGISYFRSRQERSRGRIFDQQLRRTRQKLALDVTRTWWRAVVADQAVEKATALGGELEARQKVIEDHMAQQLIPELTGLEIQERLVRSAIRLQSFQNELRKAKIELAALLGLAPGTQITFPPVRFDQAPQHIEFNVSDLEKEALHQRPELFEEDLQELIAVDEVRARFIHLFPNPAGFFGGETDQNKFLRHQGWYFAGASVAWDLFKIPTKWSKYQQAQMSEELIRERRMALAMGVIIQIHLARIEYEDALKQYDLASNLSQVRNRRLLAVQDLAVQGQLEETTLLEAESDALYAKLRSMNAHAAILIAAERIWNAVGRNPSISEPKVLAPK